MSNTLIIEGIIGAGKTTLLDILYENLQQSGYNVVKIPEPVEKWEDILVFFYEDPAKWAYALQIKVCIERIKAMLDAYNNNSSADFYLLERSPYSDTIFVETLYNQGHIPDILRKHYYEWWKLWTLLLPKTFTNPDIFIYADVDINISIERVKKRSRNGESSLTAEYQKILKAKHEDLLGKNKINLLPYIGIDHNVDILHVNMDVDFINNNDEKTKIIESMKCKLKI